MYKKDPLSGKIITTVGDEYYDNSLLYEGVSKIYFGELDILYLTFDVFTIHSSLTLFTVVLIQVYINFVKKLWKVGIILVTIYVIASIGTTVSKSVSVPTVAVTVIVFCGR
jgi:hypothetical protein